MAAPNDQIKRAHCACCKSNYDLTNKVTALESKNKELETIVVEALKVKAEYEEHMDSLKVKTN